MSLATIPTVIYHKEPTRDEIKLGLQSGADDYLWGEWDGELFQLRIKMISENSKRDIGVNPTSELPGPILIEQEIKRRLDRPARSSPSVIWTSTISRPTTTIAATSTAIARSGWWRVSFAILCRI